VGKCIDGKLFIVILNEVKDAQTVVKEQKCGRMLDQPGTKVWENKSPFIQDVTQSEILFPVLYLLIYYSIKRNKPFPKTADRFGNNFHGGRFKVNQT